VGTTLPSFLSALPKLSDVNVEGNRFSNGISASFGNMKELGLLSLPSNGLRGSRHRILRGVLAYRVQGLLVLEGSYCCCNREAPSGSGRLRLWGGKPQLLGGVWLPFFY
jgi:hypothetical protein